jgi:hypothetical protein
MTITTVAINCDIGLADNSEFTAASLTFTLSEPDYDTVSNDVIVPDDVSVTLTGTGTGTANLWPVTRGTRNSFYAVTVTGARLIDGQTVTSTKVVGNIRPPATGAPFTLADLLAQSSGGIVAGSTIYATLADAVAAALAAQAGASASAVEAAASAQDAEASAVAAAASAQDAGASAASAVAITGTIIGAGNGQFQNGSAAAPAVTFASDTNTGMYRIGADILGFSANGVERMRVNSTGDVGIGIPNPTQRLEVSGTIRVAGNSPRLSVLDTNAPTNEGEWSILGADGPLRFQALNDAGAGSGDYVEFTRVGNSGRTLRGLRSGATSYQLSNFDRSLLFSGGLSAIGTETAHDFVVRSSNTERMRVNSTGNVGIGTTAPSQRLHVEGNTLINGAVTGTAVTQTQTDSTTGRLLKVGDFGLGASTAPLIADLDSETIRAGLYRTDTSTLGVFPPGVNVFGHCVVEDYGGGNSKQTFQSIGQAGVTAAVNMPWVRRRNATTGVWSAWTQHYGMANIVRAVSQTGGVPTGGIIERGSNANGDFVRFADGTQICTTGITTSASADSTWTFPAAFSTTTNLSPLGMAYTTSTLVGIMGTGAAISTTAWTFVARDTSNARTSVFARLIAIGRWF